MGFLSILPIVLIIARDPFDPLDILTLSGKPKLHQRGRKKCFQGINGLFHLKATLGKCATSSTTVPASCKVNSANYWP